MKQRALYEFHAPLFQFQAYDCCAAVRLPTPHPTMHSAYDLDQSQNSRPRTARDRGASLTLSSPTPAPASRSLSGLTAHAAVSAIVHPLAGCSTRQVALGHRALRPQACPKVCPPICYASTPPAGPHCPLSRTSARPLPLSPLTGHLWLLQGSSHQPFGLRASSKALSSSHIHSTTLVGGAVGSGGRQTGPLFSSLCARVEWGSCQSVARGCCRVHCHV